MFQTFLLQSFKTLTTDKTDKLAKIETEFLAVCHT